jgi:hypothetical protein
MLMDFTGKTLHNRVMPDGQTSGMFIVSQTERLFVFAWKSKFGNVSTSAVSSCFVRGNE